MVGSRNPAVQDFLAFEDSSDDDIGVVIKKHTDAPLPVNVQRNVPKTAGGDEDDHTPSRVINLSP